MRRIIIIGASGAGKSTLAERAAELLGVPHIELDALHWKPNWTESSTQELREKVDSATLDGGWTMSGNYLKVKDITWARADTIVFLDYPMSLVFPQVVKRTFSRWWKDELLWGNNRETLKTQFFSKDSLFLWVINTWRKYRRDLPKHLKQAKAEGKRVFRFKCHPQAEEWLKQLAQSRDIAKPI